jgi:hypothetical protein
MTERTFRRNFDSKLADLGVAGIRTPHRAEALLAQTLAKIIDVPFSIADATSLTEAGYVGEDVENILLRLIQAADFDISRAERGIIYIDEIDKSLLHALAGDVAGDRAVVRLARDLLWSDSAAGSASGVAIAVGAGCALGADSGWAADTGVSAGACTGPERVWGADSA